MNWGDRQLLGFMAVIAGLTAVKVGALPPVRDLGMLYLMGAFLVAFGFKVLLEQFAVARRERREQKRAGKTDAKKVKTPHRRELKSG